ncbi:MAG: hypothetical protein WBM50_12345 [Acidimicrobiales bacterium]
MQRQRFDDLLVVVPGIMGSVLTHEGRDLWTVEARKLLPALLRFSSTRRILELPAGIGDGPPGDGVVATALLPDLHAIPGFWTIDGYRALTEMLQQRFHLTEATRDTAGNLVCFAYDWRLSNRLNGERLAARAEQELRRWRRHSGNGDARFVFLCHSMGGLVARWFIDVLGGHADTRTLITIGTPYQGAAPALDALVNGVHPGLGPLRPNLSSLVRSFPSVYQLLPVYPAIDTGGSGLVRPADAILPNLGSGMKQMIDDAADFHATLAAQTAAHRGDYQIYALKGHLQPTDQIAHLQDHGLELDDLEGDPESPQGDGTVPRNSSHPPEWGSEVGHPVQAFAQAHASLQNTDALHVSLHRILTADRLGRTLGGSSISVHTPDLVPAGEPVPVTVRAAAGGLALKACIDDRTDRGVLLRNDGSGRYSARLPPPRRDAHTVTVYSATPLRPVDPVTTVVTVWDDDLEPVER